MSVSNSKAATKDKAGKAGRKQQEHANTATTLTR
jgi:hypothetical protein